MLEDGPTRVQCSPFLDQPGPGARLRLLTVAIPSHWTNEYAPGHRQHLAGRTGVGFDQTVPGR